MLLVKDLLFAQVAIPTPPALDWQQLAAVYGPLLGVLAVVLKVHWDMLHRIIPQALEALRLEQRKNRQVMTRLLTELREVDMCRGKRRDRGQAARKRTTNRKGRQNHQP